MAYTRTTWSTGDTITATKLNNIEQGIVNLDNASGGGGGGSSSSELLVTVTKSTSGGSTTYTMDKTYAEIYNAFTAGTHVYVQYNSGDGQTISGNGNYTKNRGQVVTIYKYLSTYRIGVATSTPGTAAGDSTISLFPSIATFGFVNSSTSSSTIGNTYPQLVRIVYPSSQYTSYNTRYPFD